MAIPTGDFFFLRQEDPLGAQRLIVDLVARRLPARYGFDPLRDIQVLTPIYRGAAGVDALNEALQARLNADGGPSVASGSRIFRAGDRVMQARNNYDKGAGGVFNGDLGRVAWIDAESRQVAVRFSDDPEAAPVVYEPHELDELTLAYACSIHRAQGSEYRLRRSATGPPALPHAATQSALHGDHPRAPPLRDRRRPGGAAPRRPA